MRMENDSRALTEAHAIWGRLGQLAAKSSRFVLAGLILLFAGHAFADQPPEGWCEEKSGNTFVGGCDVIYPSKQAAGEAVIAREWAWANAAVAPQYQNVTDGPVVCDPNYYGPSHVECSQQGHWMNGPYVIPSSKSTYVFPICPVVNGERVYPISPEATACPGTFSCPAGSLAVAGSCVPATPEQAGLFATATSGAQSCKLGADVLTEDGASAGQPIAPATAEKYRSEIDSVDGGPGSLSFGRTYRSTWGASSSRPTGPMGKAWAHSFETNLLVTGTSALVNSAEGYVRAFTQAAGASTWTAVNSSDTLTQATGGGWTYYRANDDSTLSFNSAGKLVAALARNGWTRTYAYNTAGQLASVSNSFGRTLTFGYSGSQLTSVTTPDARIITYGYDTAGRLSTVTYPDGKTRSFVYENTSFPQALTGILDENGTRWGTFAYDTSGRATSTQLAGGANLYQVSYPSSGTASVIDPLGTSRTYSYGTTEGKLAVTGGTLPSGDGKADAASRVQDTNGLITSETDFNGVITTTTWDTTRRLPLSVTRASGTPEAQTVTTQWHATFALPTLVTETGRTTAYTYDAQGDVLSQAINDTASSPNTTRTWQWTYNAQQLVATQTAPNGAVTTYTYDTLGNLTKSTNALSQDTLYAYDTANRVTSTTAPNGLVTTFTYDNRDRVLTRTVGGQQTTTLTYNPTGTVATVTLPRGLVLSSTYDDAHRLTGWSNNRGESGTFTLDAMGNRTAEQIKDSGGAVAWAAVRTVNNINRLSSTTQGPNQTDSFSYDANGELVTATNGLNQSTQYGLDGLRRVKTITNAANATASLAWNALDAVTSASDFKGAGTSYARDAQGNATAESSADAGSRSTQYDALGLPVSIVDALGQATAITRDLLGRPTLLSFADGKTTSLSYDSTAVGKGYLASFTDRSGTTSYQRDSFGRVTAKSQTLASGLAQQVSYGYTTSGLLASTIYPDGSTLGYSYDSTGRLTQINLNGSALVSGITWNPMGQPTGWNWAFVSPSLAASRSYDTAGRLTSTEFSSYVYDAAGRMTSLTQNLYQPADTDPTHSSIASGTQSWSVGYDAVGRITGFNATGDTSGFGYDANGNRTSSTRTIAGGTTSRSYGVGGSSNQLTGFTQTQGGTTTSVSYAYNANGDLTGDGLRSYNYNSEGRLSDVTMGATDTSPTTRYAYNALGQRVFKTEPQYPPAPGDESDPGFMQSLIDFFTQLWGPSTSDADKLGWGYVYDEAGNLIAETGTGGPNSSGSTQYIWLPTANGSTPIAAVINGAKFAVHADHLNTPRRLTDANGQPVWQWAYSAFGDEKPTIAATRFTGPGTVPTTGSTSFSPITFNLRYPGQYADAESGLFYNYFRSYSPSTGRYTQADPIGLDGGWNRIDYAFVNPLKYTDASGLQAQTLGPFLPALGIGCALTQGCRGAIADALMSCSNAVSNVKNWMFSDGDNGDKHPSTPTGQRGSPLEVEPGTNEPTNIDGRDYTGHALDRMQGRGIPPSAVEDAIQNGESSPGNRPDTTVHVGPDGRLTVVTGGRGNVITVIPR